MLEIPIYVQKTAKIRRSEKSQTSPQESQDIPPKNRQPDKDLNESCNIENYSPSGKKTTKMIRNFTTKINKAVKPA